MATLSSKLVLSLVDRVSGPARSIQGALARLGDMQRRNAARLNRMHGELLGAAGAGYALARGLSAPIRAAVGFESAMADVRKVVEFGTPDGFRQMGRDILDLSTRLPMAASGIAEIAAAAGQSGMKGDEILAFAQMAAKVGVAFDMSAGETGEALARIKTALRLSVGETQGLADALNHLSNTSASSAPDLINYMKRVGATGEQYGFTATQTAAIGSAMIASGAEANVAATSFRNVGKALTRGASASRRQIRAYRTLGLDSRKVARAMSKDATGTLRNVLQLVRKLPEHMRAATLSDMFGDEARALAPLVNNMELYDEALRSVARQTDFAGSSTKEYEERAKTTAHQLNLFRNKVTALAVEIGNALLPAVNALADAAGPHIRTLTELAREYPRVTRAVVAAVAGLVGLRIAAIGLRFSLLWMKGGLLSTAIVGLRGAAGAAALAAAGFRKLRSATAGAAMLDVLGQGTVVSRGLLALMAPVATLKTALAGPGAMFAGLGAALAAVTGPVWLVAAGIAALGLAIWKYREPISNFAAGFGGRVAEEFGSAGRAIAGWTRELAAAAGEKILDVAQWLGYDRAAVSRKLAGISRDLHERLASLSHRLKESLKGLKGFFADLFDREDYTKEQEGQFRASGYKLADAIIEGVRDLPGRIAGLFAGLRDRIQRKIGAIDWSFLVEDVKRLPGRIADRFRELPAKIIEAVGTIDPGNLIAWPKPPDWLSMLWGGNGTAPAVLRGSNAAIAGARAAGGIVTGGRTYLVGEAGPELVTPSRSAYVHNARSTAAILDHALVHARRAGSAILAGPPPSARRLLAPDGQGEARNRMEPPPGPPASTAAVTVSFGDIVINNPADVDGIVRELEARMSEALSGVQADVEWAGV